MKTYIGLAGSFVVCLAAVVFVMTTGGVGSATAAGTAIASAIEASSGWIAYELEFRTPQDEVAFNQRNESGARNALDMQSLIDDYTNGRISEASFLNELWQDQAPLMNDLWPVYGQVTPCFLMDLVVAQTNGAIGESVADGSLVFFDSTQFLDESGNVLPGKARAYNEAVRANSLLNDLSEEWDLACWDTQWYNNRCCKCPVLCHCRTVSQGHRCRTTYNNQIILLRRQDRQVNSLRGLMWTPAEHSRTERLHRFFFIEGEMPHDEKGTVVPLHIGRLGDDHTQKNTFHASFRKVQLKEQSE